MSTTAPRAERRDAVAARRVLLVALAVLASALWVATPWLISPYPQGIPWYESTAGFPRLALTLVTAGALGALPACTASAIATGSEEMDADASRPSLVAAVTALFIAYSLLTPWLGLLPGTLIFTLVAARVVQLPWRTAWLLALPLSTLLWLVFVKGLGVAFGGLL